MPYHKDFEELYYRGEFPIEPSGWKPLIIEHGYDDIGNAQYFFWRVKGTRHTFKKAVSTLNHETGGEYAKAITEFLEGFREELLAWATQAPTPSWAIEYIREYNEYVSI